MRVPRQPIGPISAAPTAARARWQEPEAWTDVKDAARRAGVSERTVFRWCAKRMVVARRLATGVGPWRVLLDAEGLPMDVDAAEGKGAVR